MEVQPVGKLTKGTVESTVEADHSCEAYPDRRIAKAKPRTKVNGIFNGQLYLDDSLTLDKKYGKIQKKMNVLSLTPTKSDKEAPQTFTEQSPETTADTVFSIGTITTNNTSTAIPHTNKKRPIKSKHSSDNRLNARTLQSSLYNIQLTATDDNNEISPEIRMESKSQMKVLHEDTVPEVKAKVQSSKDGNKSSLGFRRHEIIVKYPIIKGKKPKRIRKKLFTSPVLAISESLDITGLSTDNINDDSTTSTTPNNRTSSDSNGSHSNGSHSNGSHSNDSHSNNANSINVDNSQPIQSIITSDPSSPTFSNDSTSVDTITVTIINNQYNTKPAKGLLPTPTDEVNPTTNETNTNTSVYNTNSKQAKIGPMNTVNPSDITNATLFGETSTIDKIITEFLPSSVDQCLFFYPKSINGCPTFCGITQYFNYELVNNAPLNYRTLLHMVASLGHLSTVKYLVETYKAKVDAFDCCSRTPLMVALSSPLIVEYLIKAGTNISHQDNHGASALMLVTMSSTAKIETLKLLLEAGADPLAIDVFGHSVMYHALVTSNQEMLNVLLRFVPFFPNSRVGQFTFAGKPLFTQMSSICPALLPLKFYVPLSDSLKLSLTYLEAVTQSDYTSVFVEFDDVYDRLLGALKQKEKMKVTIDYPAVYPDIYEGHKEVQSVEELEKFHVSKGEECSIDRLEIAFQCFMIVERIIGHANYNSLVLFQSIIEELFCNFKKAGLSDSVVHDKKLPILKYFLQMLLQCVKIVGPDTKIPHPLEFALKVVKDFHHTKASQLELSQLLFQIIVTYCTSLSKHHLHVHDHDGRSGNRYFKLDIRFLKFLLLDLKDSEFAAKFVKDCPNMPFSAPLIVKAVPHLDSVKLKTIDPNLFNAPNLLKTHDYFIHRVAANSRETVKKLLKYGAHPDLVNSDDNTMLSLLPDSYVKQLSSYMYPSSLYCLASKALVSKRIPYRSIGLPQHVVNHIALHDKDHFIYLKMVELGFIHHNFAFS